MAKLKPVEEPVFHLEISKEEAQLLFDILRWGVAGGGKRRLELSDSLHSVLLDSGQLNEEQPNDMEGIITLG